MHDRRHFFDSALIEFAQHTSDFEAAAQRAAYLLQIRDGVIDTVAPLAYPAPPGPVSQELGGAGGNDLPPLMEFGGDV